MSECLFHNTPTFYCVQVASSPGQMIYLHHFNHKFARLDSASSSQNLATPYPKIAPLPMIAHLLNALYQNEFQDAKTSQLYPDIR
ncbi:hypothetical protein P691DRAFT_804918 [Macrolepiota fuliginosa MF-IS2]|uniref:Uncharacterized protein n=1 Tax=Macrolepiota fuliginosa MF-IS2 TaxID=1400762 RepID=A0A9P5XMF0_9AGAR|nr:hypothetical protein P691DRAFT_804918 [Macrolepiota fuliginosa MF-IS2]